MTAQSAEQKRQRKVLRVDLGPHKDALEALAIARGVCVSQLARSALLREIDAAREMGRPKAPAPPQASAGFPQPAPRRRELRLPVQIDGEIQTRADRQGFTFQGYVLALLAAHLRRASSFGIHELGALRESNLRLTDLAQQMRRTDRVPLDLLEDVRRHLVEVRAVITRNEERWGP